MCEGDVVFACRCKLAMGLLSGQYSKPPEGPLANVGGADGAAQGQREQKGIWPGMFKSLVGKGHREFSSNRQQVRFSLSLSFSLPLIHKCHST